MFLRAIRMDGAILAVKEEIPIYKLLGVSVEEGLKLIKEYLWRTVFRFFDEPSKDYDRLWGEELRPLAEEALREAYKVFYYYDPVRAVLITNDVSLVEGLPDKLGMALIVVDLGHLKATLVDYELASELEQKFVEEKQEVLGKYFLRYAWRKLVEVAWRYGRDVAKTLDVLYPVGGYPIIMTASVKLKEDYKLSTLNVGWPGLKVKFCFVCRKEALSRLRAPILNIDRLKEILEALGYRLELEIVDVRDIDAGWGRVRRTLGVIRAGEGMCTVFVEHESLDELWFDAVNIPCLVLDEVVEDARRRLSGREPLELGWFLERAFFANEIEEFTARDRAGIVYELLRMRRDGRWHGWVDLGRWEVHIVDRDGARDLSKIILAILDKATHKVYVAPLTFRGSLQEVERWMEEEGRELVEELFIELANREDAPPELLKLVSAVLLSRSLS